MNEVHQLKCIRDGLAIFATEYKCTVTIAHDPAHLFQVMTNAPGSMRIGLLVLGEDPRDEKFSDVVGLQDRKFWIAISRGYQLESYPGKALVDNYAGGKPLFQLLGELRCLIRAMRFAGPEPAPYYGGYAPLIFDGIKLDAYRFQITIASDTDNEPVDTTVSNQG